MSSPAGRPVYRVVYRRRADGTWAARVKGLRGCRGQAATLREAREALRTALCALQPAAMGADFLEDVELPKDGRRRVAGHWAARRRLDLARQASAEATAAAVAALRELGVSLKDAADLLGVSAARAQELMRRN